MNYLNKKLKKKSSVLVVFTNDLPKKSQDWWNKLEVVIAPEKLKRQITNKKILFLKLEDFILSGSIQRAYKIINKLSHLNLNDGSRLTKLINYKGYDLWWINCEQIYFKFCLPYTQYHKLLEYLKDFNKIYLYKPPHLHIFQYFLKAHKCQLFILKSFHLRELIPIPFGVLIQVILSTISFFWLILSRPKIMVFTGDKFDTPNDYDFRMKFIYEELRKRKIHFVEFIRSLESSSVILNHAFRRKRPVIYPTAIIDLVHFFVRIFEENQKKKLVYLYSSSLKSNPEDYFWFLCSIHYLGRSKGNIFSIRIIKFILQKIGIKTGIVIAACNRNFHTVLGCKLNSIPIVGIMHGASSKYYALYDFIGFNNRKTFSVDKYGLWSDWWKEYYLKNSRAYKPEQLYVSGPMRPLKYETSRVHLKSKNRGLKILFISEQLADPLEIMPYLTRLLKVNDFDLYLKFRPYRDGFEMWLRKNNPLFLKRIKIIRGSMIEAISQSDIVVGSHSTAVLEGLIQLKPFVFFWTNKWGDYFDMKSINDQDFFAENPERLIVCIRKNVGISKKILIRLRERFFGDPYKNGSKWVVNQAEKFSQIK